LLSPGRGSLTNKKAINAEKMNEGLRKKPLAAKEFDSSTWPFFRFCYKNNAFYGMFQLKLRLKTSKSWALLP